MSNKKYAKYVEYVESNLDEIVAYTDKKFEESKDELKEKLLNEVKQQLSSVPEHYVWKHSESGSYDQSGHLREDGYVSLNQTLNEFLENEYSGRRTFTGVKRMKWQYEKWDEEFFDICYEISGDLIRSCIRKCIEEHFDEKYSNDEASSIIDVVYDTVYDECIGNQFFNVISAMDFVGIGDMLLSDIVEKDGDVL